MTALPAVTAWLAAPETTLGWQAVVLGTARVAGYLGFVMLVGTSFFLTWLWPAGRVQAVFARLLWSGAALTALAAVGTVLAGVWSVSASAFEGRIGALALARIALVAVAVALLPDDLRSTHHHRTSITLWQLAIVQTFVLSSDAWDAPWQLVKILATTAHLAATAAWLGGLLSLAAVLVPRAALDVLHDVLPRFSVVAIASVAVLALTGTVHALAEAGGPAATVDSSYGQALLVKIVVLAAALLLGNVGRQYAGRLGRGKVTDLDEHAPPESVQAFAVAIGAGLVVAVGVLVATAVLVDVAPG